MEQNNDKNLMKNILLLEKGVCDLYLHGTLEASSANVHTAFQSALTSSLTMQSTIYTKMAAKGWYPSEQADNTKITNVKQKFNQN